MIVAQLGAVTLPRSTAEKLYAGLALDAQETAVVMRIPVVTTAL